MPLLARPDGAQLHWEQTGDGPGVLICNTFNLAPVDGLVERLAASSRRVLVYEPRGLGPVDPRRARTTWRPDSPTWRPCSRRPARSMWRSA